MKLLTTENEAHSRGVQVSKQYKVANTAKMMEMLSKGVYSQPIKSCIRELVNNAVDSHLMVDSDIPSKPPILSCPTHSKPIFTIRDYGTGMPPDKLEDMYLTYGSSDKNESNELNGCFGIGSKSPFAYAKSFMTTSYYNGVKYLYANAKDERNIPTLSLLNKEDTDEDNGLEISFNVLPSDIGTFKDNITQVLHWLPIEFQVEGMDYKKEEREYELEGEGWKIRKNQYYKYTGYASHAIMGWVEYPIDTSSFTWTQARSGFGNHREDWYQHYTNVDKNSPKEAPRSNVNYVKLLNLGLELQFDIGDLEMDVSREKLQYHEYTINNIKKRLEEIHEEIGTILSQKFVSCKTLWEARVLYQELSRTKMGDILKETNIKWNNLSIDDKRIHVLNDLKNYCSIRKMHDCDARSESTEWIVFQKGFTLYEKDIKSGYIGPIKEDCEDAYILTIKDGKRQEVMDIIGITTLKKCSELPKKKVKRGPRSVGIMTFVSLPTLWYGQAKDMYWDLKEMDFSKGGIYVGIRRHETGNGRYDHPRILNSTLVSLKSLGISVDDIRGVTNSKISKFDNDSNWTNVYDYAKEKVKAYIDKHDLLSQHIVALEYGSCKPTYAKGKTGIAKQVADRHKMLSVAYDKYDDVAVELYISMGGVVKTPDEFEIDILSDQMYKRYPLLRYVSGADNLLIGQYISLVDSKEK